jgi:hypothetical protein
VRRFQITPSMGVSVLGCRITQPPPPSASLKREGRAKPSRPRLVCSLHPPLPQTFVGAERKKRAGVEIIICALPPHSPHTAIASCRSCARCRAMSPLCSLSSYVASFSAAAPIGQPPCAHIQRRDCNLPDHTALLATLLLTLHPALSQPQDRLRVGESRCQREGLLLVGADGTPPPRFGVVFFDQRVDARRSFARVIGADKGVKRIRHIDAGNRSARKRNLDEPPCR